MYTMTPVQERVLMKCMENRVALYSPHTSWDAIQGELNLLIHNRKRNVGGGGGVVIMIAIFCSFQFPKVAEGARGAL
jgi:hypothetical protein